MVSFVSLRGGLCPTQQSTFWMRYRWPRRLRLLAMTLGVAMSLCTVAPATAADQTVPIIVIRFNQPQVAFEKHLPVLVQKARAVEPNVAFYLVNYVPPNAPPMDAMPQEVSDVGNALIRLGVPPDHITYDRIYANVRTSEVHVFLR